MLFCGERSSGAVRVGSRAPSSCSLTAISLALRLFVVRGLATSKAGNAGGFGTAWLVASGSCGYSTATIRTGRRWYDDAGPRVTPLATRLRRSDVDGHHHQHRQQQHCGGHTHGYCLGQGYRDSGGGKGKRIMTAKVSTDSRGGGGSGVGVAAIDGGFAGDSSGGVRHAGTGGDAADDVGGAGAGADTGGADADGDGGAYGVGGGGVGGRDVTGGVTEKRSGGKGKAAGKAGGVKMLRLTKILADRAVGTRSEVDTMVRRGRIKVDGKVVKSPKTKLPADCVIEVSGQECLPVPLLVAYHKQRGVITSLNDDWDRKDLSTVLPKSLLRKHHPVGRLDGDTSGLLLFCSDGALTHRLLSPRFSVEREYVAKVEVPDSGEEPGQELVAALKDGIATADGVYKADVPGIDGRTIRVVVREGKNRMVRRMLANAGYPVLELRRERYGKIILGDLPEGETVPVSGEALEWAQAVLAGAGAAAEADDGSEEEEEEEGDGSPR